MFHQKINPSSRYIYCCIALWAAFIPRFAKAQDWPVTTGLSVQIGANMYTSYNHASYENFRSSYNTVNGYRETSPLGALTPTKNISYGAGAHIGPFYLSAMFHNLDMSTSATFKNGDKRLINMRYRPIDMNIDLLFPLGERVKLGMALGAERQRLTVISGYQYNYGFTSYAEDKPLNGIYRLQMEYAINWGLRTDIVLLKIKDREILNLSLRAEKVGAMEKLLGFDRYLNPMHDVMTYNALSGPGYTDGDLRRYLPEDVHNANNSYTYNVGSTGNNLAGIFRGWRFSANIIAFPLFKRLN